MYVTLRFLDRTHWMRKQSTKANVRTITIMMRQVATMMPIIPVGLLVGVTPVEGVGVVEKTETEEEVGRGVVGETVKK